MFVESYYFARQKPHDALRALLPLYVINDRMKFWAFFTKPDARATWTNGKTFRGWAQRYVDELTKLVR